MKTKRLASVVAITLVLLSVSVLGTSVTIAAKQTSGGKVFAPSATPTPPPFPKPPAPGGFFSWFTQVVKWFVTLWHWFGHGFTVHLRSIHLR